MVDVNLFQEKILQHQGKLLSVAKYWCKDPVAAQDLVAETLIRCYEKFSSCNVEMNTAGWATVVMKNLFINGYRKKKKRFAVGEAFSLDQVDTTTGAEMREHFEAQALDVTADPANYLVDKEYLQEMLNAVVRMDPINQKLLYMVAFDEMSYDEAAAKLKIPVGTVRSKLHRVRVELYRASQIYLNCGVLQRRKTKLSTA